MPADYLTVALKWLESRGKSDLKGLLAKYTVKDFNLTALTMTRVYDDGSAGSKDGGGSLGSGGQQAQQTGAPSPNS
jgi:hypothetical protein